MLLIPIFAIQLHYLPVGDSYSIPRLEGWENIKDVARHALMPVLVLTFAYLPTAFVIMRAAMFGIMESDYIRTARAKGVPNIWVVMKHGLRNALLPVLTSFMIDLGQLARWRDCDRSSIQLSRHRQYDVRSRQGT